MTAAWHSTRMLREQARATLLRAIFEYADGGTEKEWTLRWNDAAFDYIAFMPGPLCGAPERNRSVTLRIFIYEDREFARRAQKGVRRLGSYVDDQVPGSREKNLRNRLSPPARRLSS
jgi:isopentenyl diphosphate isomerase/L-lactate dehydrogenase-like FMN-dependent dehydrogenase